MPGFFNRVDSVRGFAADTPILTGAEKLPNPPSDGFMIVNQQHTQ
jgi:hypothetical protein